MNNAWRVLVVAANTDESDTDYTVCGSLEEAKRQALESLTVWPDATDALVLSSDDKVWEHYKMAAPHF